MGLRAVVAVTAAGTVAAVAGAQAPAGAADRRGLLSRLARLEDEYGRPAAALRHWKALLELDPDHVEARRRVDDLTGFQR